MFVDAEINIVCPGIDIEIESQLFKKGDSAPSDPVTNEQDNDKQGTEEEEQDEDEGQDELPRPELPSSDSLKSIVDEDIPQT